MNKELFWSRVDEGDDDECWEWRGVVNDYGYGQYNSQQAHRVMARLELEEPGESHVLHTCDNRSCVNPDHLYIGTHSDNMQDKAERNPDGFARGEEHGVTDLTEDEVATIKWKLQNGEETWEELSELYGVTERTIGNISSGSTWSHVEAQDL